MIRSHTLRRAVAIGAAVTAAVAATLAAAGPGDAAPGPHAVSATPIQHLVVIFQENVSFDHYFGTYPHAANTSGQPFVAAPGSPSVNGLTGTLLTANPNGVNPRRYDPTNVNDVLTCDQDHNYSDEQKAFDGGAMDKFPQYVGTDDGTKSPEGNLCVADDVMNYYDGNTVTALWNYAQRYGMGDNYFSTNFDPSAPGAINLVSGDTGGVDMTHTANNPSIATAARPNADLTADGQGGYSLTSDAQPYWDDCSTRDAVAMSGQNIGDELNAQGLSWGWFEGGSRPTTSFTDAAAAVGQTGQSTSTFIPDEFKGKFFQSVPHASDQGICNSVHPIGAGLTAPLATGTGQYGYKDDYIAHHEPFQYYASTANPHHLTVPTNRSGADTVAGLRSIGRDTQHYLDGQPQFDTPNHQYDTSDFDQLVSAIGQGDLPPSALPAVSFLKAPGYQDGHAAYSDPLDEQQFVVNEINNLQHTPDWSSTAVVIAYDDSDGYYDHVFSGVRNPSNTANVATPPGPQDFLNGTGLCGDTSKQTPLAGQNGRCGLGPRLPLLVISPWAKHNVVDNTVTDLSSVVKFVEDNWNLPRIAGSYDALAGSLNNMFNFHSSHGNNGTLFLDPVTGQPSGN